MPFFEDIKFVNLYISIMRNCMKMRIKEFQL